MSEPVEAAALDDAHPWPGLVSFTEASSPYFFGRSVEEDELSRRVQRETTTLLFGQSGLGKTSLLQASLVPALRERGYTPFVVRLDHGDHAPAASDQVASALKAALKDAKLKAPAMKRGEGVWEYLHRRDLQPEGDGREIHPVLILDQFEEIFTLGLASEAQRAKSQAFLVELADLIENRRPASLNARFEADPDLMEAFALGRQDYRIVVSMREDYLPQMESLRARSPSLGANRFRLTRMNGSQALEAVTGPGGALVSGEVAREIVGFVGSRRSDDPFGLAPGGARDALAELEVEPSLLSLFCQQLNEKRLEGGLAQISHELLAANRESILEAFYERAFADQPPALRVFVEDWLLTDSGVRSDVTRERAEQVLAEQGVAAGALDELVRRRILHVEERLNVPRIELIHDVLAEVVARSRTQRRERDAQITLQREVAEAREREAALRASFDARRRRFLVLAGAGGALALAIIATLAISYKSVSDAYARLGAANASLQAANDQLKRKNFALNQNAQFLASLSHAVQSMGGQAGSHLMKAIEIERKMNAAGATAGPGGRASRGAEAAQQLAAIGAMNELSSAMSGGPQSWSPSVRPTRSNVSGSSSGGDLAGATPDLRTASSGCAARAGPEKDAAKGHSVIDCYSARVAARPSDPKAYVDRANAYNDAGNYAAALADTNKALAISPGLPAGLVQMGDYYRHGWGVKEDLGQARAYYQQAADAGDAAGQYDLGRSYYMGWGGPVDYAQAAVWFEKAANQGEPNGQLALGMLTAAGKGVKQDYAQAMALLKKSAAKGNAIAASELGYLYQYGLGAPQSDAEAFAWYSKAAAKGDADSEDELGYLYAQGRGAPRDNAQSFAWFQKAAAQGNADAEEKVGLYYMGGSGVPQDYFQAMSWYRKSDSSSDQGYAQAEDNIGYLYDNGLGVKADLAEALRWYRRAADKGDATGQAAIGKHYEQGWGVAQDYAAAMSWYQKAAAQGNEAGEDGIAHLYVEGLGVPKDYAQAASWYGKAAAKGDSQGAYNMGLMSAVGLGGPQDYPQALSWFRKSAAAGNAGAESQIGYMYEHGLGIAANLEQARSWYEKAAVDGDEDAKKWVAEHSKPSPPSR